MSAAALVQFRSIDLNPAPYATGVNEQTTFERHLGHVRKGDRKPQIPPHAPENNIARIVTPFEGIGRGDGHVSPYQMPIRFFATKPCTTPARIAFRNFGGPSCRECLARNTEGETAHTTQPRVSFLAVFRFAFCIRSPAGHYCPIHAGSAQQPPKRISGESITYAIPTSRISSCATLTR